MPAQKKSTQLILWIGVAAISLIAFTNCDNGFALKKESSESSSSLSVSCGPSLNLSPRSIDETVQMINRLPKPLSVACFISHFRKPLQIFAVDNQFSAQPSQGAESPRIFIFSGNLVVSVVPAGPGRDLVEFSEITAPNVSIKGELAFPVLDTLPAATPYSKIVQEFGGTSCRVCHQSETRATNVSTGEAYSSFLIKPDPFKRVQQNSLLWFSQRCDSKADAERCRILNSIFISGMAQDADFPDKPK